MRLPWLRFFHAFSSVVRQMPGYNYPRRGMACTLPKLLCCSMYCFVSFYVLFVCKRVLYPCHWVTTQMQLTNISYHITLASVTMKMLLQRATKMKVTWCQDPTKPKRWQPCCTVLYGSVSYKSHTTLSWLQVTSTFTVLWRCTLVLKELKMV
jgi:hypothetical protein